MKKNKIRRNDPCICGSGRKYKYCCITKETKERLVKTQHKCECCGEHMVVDLSDDWLNKVSTLNLPLKNYCKDNDIYLFGLIKLADIISLGEELSKNSLSKDDLIAVYKKCITHESAMGMLAGACSEWAEFRSREQILKDAFDAHFSSKYTLSIPVLLAQIEGILRDIGGLDFKDKFKSTIPTDEWNRRLLFSMEDDSKYFNAFIAKMFEGGADEQDFNRNPILHGVNINYHSEAWSIILVLTILQISNFIWFIKNTPIIIKNA